MFEDLKLNFKLTELATQNLSQDCVENFFCLIRMKGCNNRHPTPFAFRSSYRQVVMMQLLKPSDNSNCEVDLGETIIKPEDFSKVKICNQKKVLSEHVTDLDAEICNENGDVYDPVEVTNVHYTAGWLMATLRHDTCVNTLKNDKKVPSSVKILSSMKTHAEKIVAGEKITNFLKLMVKYFQDNFIKLLETSPIGVKSRLIEGLLNSDIKLDIICHDCCVRIVTKYLNMLMKAKLGQMNQLFDIKVTTKNKNNSVSQKAQKLNIRGTKKKGV